MNDFKILSSFKWTFCEGNFNTLRLSYLHLERALAVIEEDDAQPEFGLLGDPGHAREGGQRPRPPLPLLPLLHVRLSSVRRNIHPSHLLKWNHGFYALLILGAILLFVVLAIAGARVDCALTFPRLTTKATLIMSWRRNCSAQNKYQKYNRSYFLKVPDNKLPQ